MQFQELFQFWYSINKGIWFYIKLVPSKVLVVKNIYSYDSSWWQNWSRLHFTKILNQMYLCSWKKFRYGCRLSMFRNFHRHDRCLYRRDWWCCRTSWLFHLFKRFCECYCLCCSRNLRTRYKEYAIYKRKCAFRFLLILHALYDSSKIWAAVAPELSRSYAHFFRF